MQNRTVEIFYSAKALLGEGPLWMPDEQKLYFLDIEGLLLYRLNPDTRVAEQFPLPNKVGCIAPCRNGNFLIAAETGIEEIRIAENRIEPVCRIAHPEAGQADNRYNDGKCSLDGRFFFGSINRLRKNEAALYVLDKNGCRKVIDGAANSNGLGWSPDGKTFYWIDTPTRNVDAFDYNLITGALSNRRTAVRFADDPTWGRPDGMTVDADGNLWVAHWLGWRITRWNPNTGKLLETVPLPVARVTSLTFGGEQLDTLFITTASSGLQTEEQSTQPDAGGIFAYRPYVRGVRSGQWIV